MFLRFQTYIGYFVILAVIMALGFSVFGSPSNISTKEKSKQAQRCDLFDKWFWTSKKIAWADPVADAQGSLSLGDFRFRCTTSYHWGRNVQCYIQCTGNLYNVDNSKQSPLSQPRDIMRVNKCGQDYANVASKYVKAYNTIIFEHPKFPHKDICSKPKTAKHWKHLENQLYVQPNEALTPSEVMDLPTAARFGKIKLVQDLISNGENPTTPDVFGMTALHWASARGYENIVDLLLSEQTKISPLENSSHNTTSKFDSCFFAARGGHISILKKVLPPPPRIQAIERALQGAIQGKHTHIVRFLIEDLKSQKKVLV